MVDALLAKFFDGGVEVADFAIETDLHFLHFKGDGLGLAAEFVLQAVSYDDAFGTDFALEEVTEGFKGAAFGLQDQVGEIARGELTQADARVFDLSSGSAELACQAGVEVTKFGDFQGNLLIVFDGNR